MTKKRLLIDLGHTERFPGASGFMSEVQWNRSILPHLLDQIDSTLWEVIQVPSEFKKENGYHVSTDGNDNLVQRIKWINANSTSKDYLISVHGNSAARDTVRGVTTCYLGGSNVAMTEAGILSHIYQSITGVPVWLKGTYDDRESRFGRLGIIRDTNPFTLLIEAGFVSNKEDMQVAPALAAKAIAYYYNHLANPNYSMPTNVPEVATVPANSSTTAPVSPELEAAIQNISGFLVNGAPIIGNVSPSIMNNAVTRSEMILITSRIVTVLRELIQRDTENAQSILNLQKEVIDLTESVRLQGNPKA